MILKRIVITQLSMVEKIKPPGSDFSMRLGSSCLERVVIPYTNSSSTNPNAKVMLFLEPAIYSKKTLARCCGFRVY